MSTNTPDAHKRSSQEAPRKERFEPDTEPRPLTSDDLNECREPTCDLVDATDAHQRAVFAVAARNGTLYRPTPGRTLDIQGVSILYVSDDGEQATQRRLQAAPGDLSLVNRALIVNARELQPTPDDLKRFAPIAQRHPEV